jgi:hypothetical protein
MTPTKKLWTEFKYWIVILLFFGFIFEMVASMVLYRKYTTGKLAILHVTKDLFGSKSKDAYAYEPWLMFRAADYSSSDFNTKGFERQSTPAEDIVPGSADTLDVYFFGGSTLYGPSLSDAETIPSQLVKLFKASNPHRSIRVRNFGQPLYYSRQELMLLSKLIFEGHRPDIVVFLDGATDFDAPHMLYYDKPYFSYALQQTFEGKMFQKGGGHFVDSTSEYYKDPAGVDAHSLYNQLANKYTNNLKQASALCTKTGIKCYFFCEQKSGSSPRLTTIYSLLQKNNDSIPNFNFLKSSDRAAQILSTIKNDLQ